MTVVDDLLYVIGGYCNSALAINEQYVPIGYSSTMLTSEPESSSIYLVVVVVVLTTGIIGAGLIFYKKRKNGVYGRYNFLAL